MKLLLSLFVLLTLAVCALANNPENTYKHTFTVKNDISEDDAYLMIQEWFTQNPCTFTSSNNTNGVVCSNRNKKNADIAFSNKQPLQSIDPNGKKFSARCLAMYSGNSTSNISMLYVEYYLVIEIAGEKVTASISPMKYHHFNKNTFAPQQIYTWQTGRPCDAAGNVCDLVNNIGPELSADLQNYLKQDTARLFNAIQAHLQQQQALASN